ncbi:MAG: SEC-C domain-containing protein [Bacteroidota bacterium]
MAGVLTLEGDLDIVDTVGEYWDTFIIKIVVPIHSYPNCIPTVYEVSSKIKRTDDYHISIKGECCLDIPHRLIHIKQQGICLLDFISNIVYPYFANQAYKIFEKKYAGEEWKHGLLGIVQYYKDEHNIIGCKMIYDVLGMILKEDPKLFKSKFINKQCFCGSEKKYKGCHSKSIHHIKNLGTELILSDRKKLFTYINELKGNPTV